MLTYKYWMQQMPMWHLTLTLSATMSKPVILFLTGTAHNFTTTGVKSISNDVIIVAFTGPFLCVCALLLFFMLLYVFFNPLSN